MFVLEGKARPTLARHERFSVHPHARFLDEMRGTCRLKASEARASYPIRSRERGGGHEAFLGGLREQLVEHLEWMDSDRRRRVIFDGFDKALTGCAGRWLIAKPAPDGLGYRISFRADGIMFDLDEEPVCICATCVRPRVAELGHNPCTTCGGTELLHTAKDSLAKAVWAERYAVWRWAWQHMKLDRAPMIFRAESTLRDSEKLNLDDVFSPTEMYELMFRDIPIQANRRHSGQTLNNRQSTSFRAPPRWKLESTSGT